MNEVMEILYQWHQGAGIKAITRSLGYDRKTVRRYVHAGLDAGLKREEPFPDEQEMLGKLKAVMDQLGSGSTGAGQRVTWPLSQ